MTMNYTDHLSSILAPQKAVSDILVMGVGGAGGNAVNHMHDLGILGVSFMVCNTDRQALQRSPIEKKIQLGSGHGAGNNPEKGKNLAIESLDDIMLELDESKARMIFITAGLGGGTGTGAAPIIAKAARSKGLLTVSIVTLPFTTEGPKRMGQALKGLDELKANSDSIVVIHNDNIAKIYGTLPVMEAFHKADDVLATAAKGIAEMITRSDYINVDLEDVRTTLKESGIAVMGSSRCTGEGKVDRAVDEALASPLLDQRDIKGAREILFNLSWAESASFTMDDVWRVQNLIQARASLSAGRCEANVIFGAGASSDLCDDEIELTVIASRFETTNRLNIPEEQTNNLNIKTEEEEDMGIKWEITERYKDIETLLIEPAYFRRGRQLTGTTAKGTKATVGELLNDEQSNKEVKKEDVKVGSLF